jgi:O-succinylbenzoate-CoA ligase
MTRSPNLGQILAHRARRHPERTALVEATRARRFSYAELNRRANRVASGLARAGINPGDRVAVLMANGVEFVETYFGLAKLGATLVPLNHRLAPAELDFILRDADVAGLVYDDDFDRTAGALRDLAVPIQIWVRVGGDSSPVTGALSYRDLLGSGSGDEPDPRAGGDDPLFVMYTSGTTGRPKGAVHTHESLLWASLGALLTCDIRDGDRELVVLPLFHIGALLPLTWELHAGGTAVVLRSFDPDVAVRAISHERITTGLVVPTILQMLFDHPEFDRCDRSSLRWLMAGGAPVPPPLLRRATDAGIVALQEYGSTEAAAVTIATPEDAIAKPESAGRPFIHTEVRIVDEQGNAVSSGMVGEIVVRARHVMKAYWRQPEATADAIRDGWFHTSDVGYFDAEGRIYIRDRRNDLIISGGENIYPAEVERVLIDHPLIREVAVIGQPSAKWGESPIAIVVPSAGAAALTAEDLVAYCRGRLAGYKIPRRVELVELLPRTPTGKVQKHILRARFPGPAPE